MTREEAIKQLKSIRKCYIYITPNLNLEAIDMAIEALKNEINCVKCVHYTERETYTGIKGVCKMDTAHREDLISRQDAIKPFCIAPDGTRIPEVDCDNFPVEFSVEFIKKHLLSLPSTEPYYMGCHGCVHYDQQQTSLICHDCKRYYKDMYKEW